MFQRTRGPTAGAGAPFVVSLSFTIYMFLIFCKKITKHSSTHIEIIIFKTVDGRILCIVLPSFRSGKKDIGGAVYNVDQCLYIILCVVASWDLT